MFLNDMPKKIILSAKQCLLYGTCINKNISMHLLKKDKNNITHILCLEIIGTKIKKSEVIRSVHHHISELVRRFSKIST